MKLISKLSALGAVLVLSTAFASADPIIFGSNQSTTTYTGYNSNPLNETPTANTSAVTYNISAGTMPNGWTKEFQNTNWVSFDPNSGPTGGETGGTFDANGTYTYKTTFTTTGGTYVQGFLSVMADDTTSVWLNGVEILDPGTIGSDDHCADGAPNCVVAATITLDSATAGFNNDGVNLLQFVVQQTGSNYQGLDFLGSTSTTPEPNTLLLLGTGLMGSAGALFRRMRSAVK